MVKAQKTNTAGVWYALAVSRISLGFIFVWAFVDKLWGLGIATPAARAWVNGGSPTTGFLKGVEGPFADLFHAISGQAWADWLFMLGLLGIGLALILGVAIRLAAVAGFVLLFMMWMASLPLQTNPLIDDHLVYAAILAAIVYSLPEQRWGLGKWWQSLPFIKQNRWLW